MTNPNLVHALNAIAHSKSFLVVTVGQEGTTTTNVECAGLSIAEAQSLIASAYMATTRLALDLSENMENNQQMGEN